MTPSTTSASPSGEVQGRFHRLRRLRDDDGYRIRVFTAISVLFLFFFVLLAFATITIPSIEYDLHSTVTLQRIHVAAFAYAMFAISALGFEPWAALIVAVTALLVGRLMGWRDGLYIAVLAAGQGALNSVLKSLVNRPRPAATLVQVLGSASGTSFPSGHVMFYTVFFGFLFFLVAVRMPPSWLKRIVLVITGGLILLIGPSRMYLGAHWLTDVIASYLLGAVLLLAAIEGYLRYLAPRTPTEAEGVVGEQDKATSP